MTIGIKAIEYILPEKILTNENLAQIYKDWSSKKILDKTGIESRHVVSENECASDLAEKAAIKLFDSGVIKPEEIDFILLATQSPDYQLPTTACILQDKLGIPQSCGALDFNLGCSAYIYGLALAKSLINTCVAKNILLLTAETYTKYIHPLDKSTRTIFGDAGAATLICDCNGSIREFDLGTDGSGYESLIIPSVNVNLYMSGLDIFNFTIRVVPQSINNVLEKNNLTLDDIDLFVFHQANKFMLDYLRKIIKIPEDKFYVNMKDIGNTVSASIPIALKRARQDGKLHKGDKVLLTGFGVGLSWGSTIITY